MDHIAPPAGAPVRDPMTGDAARFLFTAVDNRGVPGRFDYHEGSDGHVFLGNVPADLGRHYEGGYQPIPRDERELADAARGEVYRLRLVHELVPSGRFLEIGPWIGLVAYGAKMAGYDVSALEMNGDCVALMNASGIRAVRTDSPADALKEGGEAYEVIGLWHSIEHLPRPWEVLDAAAAALAPGGALVVAAPNPESAQLRAFGRHWLHLDAPRHLHLLPMSSIEAIGRRRGLVTVHRTTDDELGELLDRSGWRWELQRRARRLPVLRTLAFHLFWRSLRRRHRRPGVLDGAAFTLVMMRPGDGPGPWDRPV